jgi:prefoldin subunit 5
MKQSLTENQIIQMAQQEENNLQKKQQYLSRIESILKDTILTIESLKEIQKKPSKTMIKIGLGVMMEAEIKTNKCSRAFAENGYKEEKIDDTINWLKKRRKNIESQIKKIIEDINKTKNKLNELIKILKQIENEKRKNISVK